VGSSGLESMDITAPCHYYGANIEPIPKLIEFQSFMACNP